MARALVVVSFFVSMLLCTPQRARDVPLASGRVTIEATMPTPNGARIDSLIDLMFDTFNVERPEEIEIILLPYTEYEELLSQDVAGPSWRAYLDALRREGNAGQLTSSGFWVRSGFPRKLTIVTWQVSDETLVHEVSHYICHRISETLRFGWHRQGMPDCTNATSGAFWHSKVFRQWLRDRPWR